MRRAETWLWTLAGLCFILAGLPLYYRKVPPNRWYGFRLPKTLGDERIWYAANQTAGFDLFLAGLVILLTALSTGLLAEYQPGWLPGNINQVVFWMALGAVLIHSFWALSKL